jgi:hypothetical protein
VPLDAKETSAYALQTVFRARSRGGFKPQIGETRYAVAVYEKLIRATLTVANEEAEHHNMYLLVSLDIGSHYADILENKIIPFVVDNKSELFLNIGGISEKYWD